jgi:transposase
MDEVKVKDQRGQVIYCGIDTHQNSWKVAIMQGDKFVKVFSQVPGSKQLAAHLQHNYPGATFQLGYEAGFCGFWIAEELTSLGMECKVLHAADIPTTDKERRQKTDARDCRKIAASLTNPGVHSIHIPDKTLQYDRSIVRARQKISRDATRARNRVKSHLYFYGLAIGKELPRYWSKGFIDKLRQWSVEHHDIALGLLLDELIVLRQLKAKALQELRKLARQERYAPAIKLLMSIPGMGLLHALSFATEIGDIQRFKNLDQLCSMVGLIPNTNASGEKAGVGRMSKRGKAEVKNLLIEAAWIAIRCDPDLKASFERLSQKMPKNKAIVRIARKLLNRIRAVLMQNKPYQIATT